MNETVEFSRLVGIVVRNDPVREAEIIVAARANYEAVKAKRFPDWPDENEEILVTSTCPHCGKHTNVGWYAEVPIRFVQGSPP